MTFASVLFRDRSQAVLADSKKEPAFFKDLYLDQVFDSIVKGREEYELLPFFYFALQNIADVQYRQAVFKDLEKREVYEAITNFTAKMLQVRRYLKMIDKLYYKYHKEGWLVEAASVYCQGVKELVETFKKAPITSKGLKSILDFAKEYVLSDYFQRLCAESTTLKEKVAAVQYNLIIKGNRVRVRKYELEADYSKIVQDTFEKFKNGDKKSYRINITNMSGMSHVDAEILNCLEQLFPDVFDQFKVFYDSHQGFASEFLLTFDREIQFYLSYLEYISRFQQAELPFCYPIVSESKEVKARQTFDIALGNTKLEDRTPLVLNDFYLKGKERIFVVTGPNQGGKTTFARMFGQLHYLASLGGLVPGNTANLLLFDEIYTHFESEEDIKNKRGKLQDDLVRIHAIMEKASSKSIIIMNELFTSTKLNDAVFLSTEIITKISQLDALGVFVTFIDELSRLNESTVSVVSTIFPNDPARRTFKIVRLQADGKAYAMSIAQKHGLTFSQIIERIDQ